MTSNIKLFNPDITQSPDTLPLHEVKTEPEPEEKSENGYVTVLKWVVNFVNCKTCKRKSLNMVMSLVMVDF